MNRAILFSQYSQEWSCMLEKAETFMNNQSDLTKADINTLLELYKIKEHFDSERYLAKWSYWQKAYYVKLVDIAFILTQKLFLTLEPAAISKTLEQLDGKNIENFWKLFDFFQLHGKINRFVLCRLMDKYPAHARFIVQINQQN
ncbi:MAG: hypothetical protein EOO43_07145 [Flavobacterium sp.]|nr:MAG: hypothetical protein EOO43_07145 [Flavobacterium sp.]